MYKYLLWALKIGAVLNIYFLFSIYQLSYLQINNSILVPAVIFFIVSIYRCLFPVSYATYAVLHNTIFSSVFITRFLATFSEIAYIYLFSYLIRLINNQQLQFVDAISYIMVLQVTISQIFVWLAILTEKMKLYVYEEIGWEIIFFINTLLSIILLIKLNLIPEYKYLLYLNIIFGLFYLPWQLFHLRYLYKRSMDQEVILGRKFNKIILQGLNKALFFKKHTTDGLYWGGSIGYFWMFSYWASVIPLWIFIILKYSI